MPSYTYATITELMRVMLLEGGVSSTRQAYTDTALLPAVNSARREVFDRGIEANVPRFVTSTSGNIPASTTAITTTLPAGGLNIPADLVVPIELSEKKSGEGDDQYVQMEQWDYELPDYVASDRIGHWAWQGGPDPTIKILSASAANTVRIRYQTFGSDYTGTASTVTVFSVVDAIAHWASAIVLYARGEDGAGDRHRQRGEERLQTWLNIETQRQQRVSARNRPYRETYYGGK